MIRPKVRYVARELRWPGITWGIFYADRQNELAISANFYTYNPAKKVAAAMNLKAAIDKGEIYVCCD